MKKSIQSVFLTFALLAVLSSCTVASTPIPPASTSIPPALTPIPPTFTPEPTATATPIVYKVAVDVVDEKNNPISEAKIIQGETVEFTDNQGVWNKSIQTSGLSISVWAQGYLLQKHSSTLQPGDNKIHIQLSSDPKGLQTADLIKKGYKLVFAEDFQDNIPDCMIEGNGSVVLDDTDAKNYLLLVDLRNLKDASFGCSFGPTNIQNAIIEADFRYVDIRYNDFKQSDKDGYFNWQGYAIGFRDGFDVEGYPLQVPWGPTLQIRDFRKNDWKFPITVNQGIQENHWYQLSTRYDGAKVETRLNGLLKFTFLNAPKTNNTKPAAIGAFSQAHIQFDNIKMWILSD